MHFEKKINTSIFRTVLLSWIIFSLAMPAHAFRQTKQESFTDPDYFDYQPNTITVMVNAENLEVRDAAEKHIIAELEKRNIKALPHKKLFPPTREWDDAKRAEIYKRYSIEANLVITAGASSKQVTDLWSQTYGNATGTSTGNATARTFGGNTNINSRSTTNVSGNSTTVQYKSIKSQAAFSAILVDVQENQIAWTTDIYIKAGGLLFVGGKRDAKAAAKSIIKSLIKDKHIPAK